MAHGGRLCGGDRAVEGSLGGEVEVVEDPIRRHVCFGKYGSAAGIATGVPRQLPRHVLLVGDDDPGAPWTTAATTLEVVEDAAPRLLGCGRCGRDGGVARQARRDGVPAMLGGGASYRP